MSWYGCVIFIGPPPARPTANKPGTPATSQPGAPGVTDPAGVEKPTHPPVKKSSGPPKLKVCHSNLALVLVGTNLFNNVCEQ